MFLSRQDYQSEKFIQETLDRVSKGRTTITVSHRLSTIRSADRIVFIERGVVVEDGTYNQLMAMKGRYHEVITAGNLSNDDDGLGDDSEATVNERPKVIQRRHSKHSFSTEENCFQELLSIEEEESTELDGKPVQYGKIFARIVKFARPEWFILITASIAALLIGTSNPIFTVLFAELFGVSV